MIDRRTPLFRALAAASALQWALMVAPALGQGGPGSAGSQADGEQQTAAESAPDVVERVPVKDVPSDSQIESRLAKILKATEWFEDVTVEVRDTVTFLAGTTTTTERKEWAGRLARNTEGVAAVVNQIDVDRTFNPSRTAQVVYASVRSLWNDFLAHSPLILAGLAALVLTGLVARLANALGSKVANRSHLRPSLQDLMLQLLTIAIWSAGLLVAAVIIFPGMTPARALTVLGLGSVAIGFAFKDIFENFFAGVLILWKYPFDKGDFIECGDIHGRIEDITIRISLIRQVDGQLVVVPNAALFKNPVDVLTNRPHRRTTVICGVAYDTDLDHARDVITKAVQGCPTVEKHDRIEIFAQEFADSSINFEVTWWTGSTPRDIRESRDEVVRAVKRALDGEKIEIPFPQRTLWLPEPVETRTAADSPAADSSD